MNIEQVREYALTLPGTTEDMPYGPDWLIFRIEGKIFLHIWLEAPEKTYAVKLKPEVGAELREQYDAIRPAYHLNKIHWNDILIENYFSNEQIEGWIKESYSLVLSNLPRRLKENYMSPTYAAK